MEVRMQCIFCKSNSFASKSVEHIIPESLYNTTHILPPGIVCDGCNNYFARKVEKPFLDSPTIRHLRFCEGIPNKRGRIPPSEGILWPNFPITVFKEPEQQSAMHIDLSLEAFNHLLKVQTGKLIFPITKQLPEAKVISRFLAKMALEAIAWKLWEFDGGIKYLIDDTQFDPIRNFARRGEPQDWPYHIRKIYPSSQKFRNIDGSISQTVHEFDFLMTRQGELYFVFILFGVELAINIGGPMIDGYIEWLLKNENASPLYSGKNTIFLKDLIFE
jgi:hypothetical protein